MTTPRPWRQAWQDALYGPDGFYRRAEGPAGHFLTATHGAVGVELARGLLAYLDLAWGMPVAHVVDIGAGRGELAGTLAELAGASGRELRVTAVDIVDRPDGLDPRVEWLRSPGGAALPPELAPLLAGDGVAVVAHEWLDVVPCPIGQVDEDGTLREVLVDADGQESLGEPLTGADLAWADRWWPTGEEYDRVEVGRPRDEAWGQVLRELRSGVAVAVDYGHRAATRPPAGTLTGFRAGREELPVPDGGCDLTAHVAMDSLGADEVTTQREALRAAGVYATLPDSTLGRTEPGRYLAELTTANARAQLLSSGGFGGFLWAVTVRRP